MLKSGDIPEEVIQRVTLKTVEVGVPIDDTDFSEGEAMRELVRRKLLFLAGIISAADMVGKVEKLAEHAAGPAVEPVAEAVAKPAETTIQPEVARKRTFDFPGSYGPDAPDVKKIAQAHKDGYPVTVYEFMQGMVDYGKGHEPPPRIWIEHKSGKRYTYEGNGEIIQSKEDPITAIEFINGGTGMPPEDVIINRHVGTEDTLGEYGKGLTLALTYIMTQEMVAKINSHHKLGSWIGETYFVPTETGVAKVLAIKGEWGEPKTEKATTIRVENPTDKFIKEVAGASDFFLYANPRFSEAVLVRQDEESQKKTEQATPVDRGKVTCLEGIVSQKSDGTHDSIFIDGLRVPLERRHSILPWSIQGLGKADDYWLRVSRSHNSMSYTAFEISTPVLLAVQQLKNRNLLERLITCAMQKPRIEYLEFMSTFRGHVDLPMAEVTAGLVKEIWKEKYGERTIIATSQEKAAWYKKFSKDKKEVKLVPTGLYEFLARAGVPTVESETAVTDVISIEGLNNLSVPSANSPDKFDKMMDYIAQINGEAKLVEEDDEQKMIIKIPRAVRTLEEFNGQVEYSDGIVIRTVAAIAYSSGLDCKIFAVNGEYIYEISMEINTEKTHIFSTKIEIRVIEKNKKTEYADFKEGNTYIILSGDGIVAFCETDPAATVAAKKEEKEKKKENMPKYDKTTASLLDGIAEKTVSHGTLGQIKITNQEETNGEIDEESRYPNDYYQEETGSAFLYDEENGVVYWGNEYQWIKEEIPKSEPASPYSTHVVTDLKSKGSYLRVPAGYKIAGIKTEGKAKFAVYRDKRTGRYRIAGIAKRLVYYTCPDKKSEYDRQEPLLAEKEDILEKIHHLLLPEWRNFIEMINANPALNVHNKIALVQEMWNRKFVYDKDYALNDQIKGSNKEEVAAKILNASRGICNLSATGFALLLRAIGIPSRVSMGYWKQNSSHEGRHMWIEYWNGTRWIAHETEVGIKSVDEEEKISVSDFIERLRGRLKELEETVMTAQRGAEGLLQKVPLLMTRQGFNNRVKRELRLLLKRE